jgi:hypothetical protein
MLHNNNIIVANITLFINTMEETISSTELLSVASGPNKKDSFHTTEIMYNRGEDPRHPSKLKKAKCNFVSAIRFKKAMLLASN